MRRLAAIFAVAAEREGVRPGDWNTSASPDCVERYTPIAQVLHWLTALLMLVAVVLAWIFMAMPDTVGDRFTYITLHKSVGQTIFLLAVFRLIWRQLHPPPLMAARL